MAATSDIHSPRYLGLLRSALERTRGWRPCIVVLAGDIVDRGVVEAAKPVFQAIREALAPGYIVAVFGNEEYHDREDEFRKSYPDIHWLSDEYRVFDCGEVSVAVVGTRGALARLTRWQRRHMPWLARVYAERPRIIAGLIREARREASVVVLASHYALSRATIRGEPERIWPELYSPAMERVLAESRPDAAVHGHAHNGTPRAVVHGVPVYNVALPLVREIVEVEPRARRTLLDYTQ